MRNFNKRIGKAQKSIDNTVSPWLSRQYNRVKKRYFGGKK